MSAQILEFPVTIRIEDFMAEAAMREQIRMALGAVCGIYHGKLTDADRMFALAKIEEALTLMRAERGLERL